MISKLRNTIGGTGVVIQFDDVYADLMVMERDDMTVTDVKKTAVCFTSETSEIWVVREFGYNAAAKMIYCKLIEESETKPSWVPDTITGAAS